MINKANCDNIFAMKQENNQFEILLAQAEKGDSDAMIEVARCYEGGINGAEKDVKLALWWMLQAGNAGNAQAQYELALWYSDGFHCEVDFQKSVYWCKRAAVQGIEEAVDYIEVLQSFDV